MTTPAEEKAARARLAEFDTRHERRGMVFFTLNGE